MDFDPLPLGVVAGNADVDSEAMPLLPPVQADAFGVDFRSGPDVRSTYLLERGVYLFIDPDLRPALRVVRQKQSASPEEKLQFLTSPRLALKMALGEDADELELERIDRLFVETAEYSDRILSIGEWQPPSLGFVEREPNNWLPERFSVVIGGKIVTGKPEDVEHWLRDVEGAMAAGRATVEIAGVEIPISTSVVQTLQTLLPPEPKPAPGDDKNEDPRKRSGRALVYLSKENFEAGSYTRKLTERQIDGSLPPNLRTQLRPHQKDGIDWLIACFAAGWPESCSPTTWGWGRRSSRLCLWRG